MIVRIALLFVGFILAGVFLNLYYLAYTMFAIVLLGIENKILHDVAYWICLIAGFVTTFYILRGPWATAGNPKRSKSQVPKV